MTPLQQLLAGALALYAAWRVVRMLFSKSPVDNIPGPDSESYLTGE